MLKGNAGTSLKHTWERTVNHKKKKKKKKKTKTREGAANQTIEQRRNLKASKKKNPDNS